jgi:hypothetical protein
MGYDIYITRKNLWFDDEGSEIELTEWIAYVTGDAEMRLDGFAETMSNSGDTLRVESEGLSVWLGYSGHQENGNMAWFDFRRGNIVVKNPDTEILKKMWSIATALSAKVQGDEGELYDVGGNAVDEQPPVSVGVNSKKPWWKVW